MTSPRLVSANFMKNEAHCVEMMLDSVQPFVEESYVLIDSTTTDNTAEICESRGCIVKHFDFENFGKTWNTLLKWINNKGDWSIFISPDETIDKSFGDFLQPIIDKVQEHPVDGVWFCRRHWEDLEKEKEYTKENWYPDWQLRLLRLDYPRIHLTKYVHEWPAGLRQTIRTKLDIHHYNVYWKNKIDYDFDAMNELYDRLKEEEKKENGLNIWP